MPYSYLSRYGRLKQVALRSVAHSLAADSAALTDLREMFDVLDPDHRGFISHEAMLQARLFTTDESVVYRIKCEAQNGSYQDTYGGYVFWYVRAEFLILRDY